MISKLREVSNSASSRHASFSITLEAWLAYLPRSQEFSFSRICVIAAYVRHCSGKTSRTALPFTKFLPFIGADSPGCRLLRTFLSFSRLVNSLGCDKDGLYNVASTLIKKFIFRNYICVYNLNDYMKYIIIRIYQQFNF